MPSAWMMALSPGLPDVGAWQRTTVATAKGLPCVVNSVDFFKKSSNIQVPQPCLYSQSLLFYSHISFVLYPHPF
jgi:hypothetical protein